MLVADLERTYNYHYWANRKLMGVVQQLTPDEFTRVVGGSYGSVRNTLVHMLSAEQGWLDRCGGPPRGERLNPEDVPAADVLTEAWARVEAQMRQFLAGLDARDPTRVVEFTLGGGAAHALPLGDLLQHAAVHAVHHRGQVALLLRMLGHAPGNFDFLFYAADPGGGAA